MKKILLNATLFVASLSFGQVIWSENFETQTDFSVDAPAGWVYNDVDGTSTWASDGYDFDNEGYTGVGIIYNHTTTNPDGTGTVSATYEGNKGLYFFAADPANGPINNDWAVMPQVTLGTNSSFKFWAKSITALYGLERMKFGVSTTGTNPADFTIVTPGAHVLVPVDWTEYIIDLSAYNGQQVYLGINYVGNDSFILQTDQYELISTLSSESFDSAAQTYVYPSPAANELNLKLGNDFNTENVNVTITNMLGQVALTSKVQNNTIDVSSLSSGVYSIEINDGVKKTSRKFNKK